MENSEPTAPTTDAAPMTPVQTQGPAPRTDMNVIYIGKKSVMSYVLAVVTQFNNGAPEVYIKARGKIISRAVDVEQIVRNRFLPDVKLDGIVTKTEEMDSEDGTKTKVSAIEIKLVR